MEITSYLSQESIQAIINSNDFYFQKGKDALEKWMKAEYNPAFAERLLQLSKNYENIQEEASHDADLQNVLESLFEIISYCDSKANNKNRFNKYDDKRVLAMAAVRMGHWVRHLILYKLNPNELPFGSTRNAFEYLLNPEQNATILSEKHRRLVAQNLFQVDFSSTDFVRDLRDHFSTYNLKTVNPTNYTHLLSRLIYSMENEWKEEVVGLMASDGTGWQDEFIDEMEGFDAAIVWNSKRPSGGAETLKFLESLVEEGNEFSLYYASNGYVRYRASVIDFLDNQTDLNTKDWSNKYKIANFREHFDEYENEKRSAKIIFLISELQKVDPIPVSAFKFYKNFDPPRQDNLSPVKFEPTYSTVTPDSIDVADTEPTPLKETSFSLNQILYGPPGTGKTYSTITKALEIIGEDLSGKERTVIKELFDKKLNEGQIEFITFHQSYGYEDFVVGLKPDAEFESLRFKPNKGIFYEIARRARENFIASKEKRSITKDFRTVFNEIVHPLSEGKEVEVKMKSGISFWIYDLTPASILFRKQSGNTKHTLSIDSLEELVADGRKTPAGLEPYYTPLVNLINENRSQTAPTPIETKKNFVLIIDEINRANISRVFGELITLLEEDKRMGELNELRVTLPNGEKGFCLPPNLYLLGTMNTADKSIALVDIALRRRFEFIGYYPNYNLPELSDLKSSILREINSKIYEKRHSADYLIGHAYFLNENSIESILRNKVIPLTMEYFQGKVDVVSEIVSTEKFKVSYNKETYSWDIQANLK